MNEYWLSDEHRNWQEHYLAGDFRDQAVLAFSDEFRRKYLPDMHQSGSAEPEMFEATILDTNTDRLYSAKLPVVYESFGKSGCMPTVCNADWEPVSVETVGQYYYGVTCCGCVLAEAIFRSGQLVEGYHDMELTEEEDKCPSNRFYIAKLVWPLMPDLILLSDTTDVVTLQRQLEETLAVK